MASTQTLPDKWQVVRNSNTAKTKKPEQIKAVFRPVPISKTNFESLDYENSDDSNDDQFESMGNGKKMNGKIPTKNGKKGMKNGNVPETKTVPDLIPMDFAKLAGSVAICRDKFHGNDLLILQDVANFLRMDADFSGAIKLSPSSTSPSNACEDFGFPLKHLNPRQLAELRTIVGSVQSEEGYTKFIEYAVEEMTIAFSKGDSLLSHRLCLQLISIERPEAFLSLAEKYAGILKSSKNIQNKLLAIMCVFSQAGLGSLSVGLNVWFTVMLPTIQLPNLCSMTLQYGEKLLSAYNVLNETQLPPSSAPQAVKPAFDLLMTALQNCQPYNPPPNYELFAREVSVSPYQFFRLFDMVYPVNANTGKVSQAPWMSRMTPAQKRQLATLCFKIKVLLFKFGCDSCPSSLFPSFLIRYNDGLPVYIRKELLSNLLVCLHCDQQDCSEAWLGTCSRYPHNASFLSGSVNESLPFFAEFIDVGKLRKTMKKVDSLVQAAGVSGSGHAGSDGKSRGIIRRTLSATFYLTRNVTTLLVLALVADLLISNCDPQAMHSTKFLRQYKLYTPLVNGWGQVQKTSMKAVNSLYPYCAQLFSHLAPYSVKMGETLTEWYYTSSTFIFKYYKTARTSSNYYTGQADTWLVAHGVDLKSVGNWVSTTAYPAVVQHVQDGSAALSSFYSKNLLPLFRQFGLNIAPTASTQGL